MVKDNEKVYDEQINPLMTKIIAICKKHKIPMLATFEYAPQQMCTTRIPFDGEANVLGPATQMVRNGFAAVAMTRSAL